MFFGRLEKLYVASGLAAGLNLLSVDDSSAVNRAPPGETKVRRRHTLNGPYSWLDDRHSEPKSSRLEIVHRHQVVPGAMDPIRPKEGGGEPNAQPGTSKRTNPRDSNDDHQKRRPKDLKKYDDGGKTMFVGNISYRITQKDLRGFFSKFGRVVRVQLLKDHIKKHSRGIAFVTFTTQRSAQDAQEASAEERTLDDREMRVFPARDRRMKAFKKELNESEPSDSPDSETSDCEGLTSILDDDSLLVIFSYLPLDNLLDVELVCARWKRLVGRCWAAKRILQFTNSFMTFDGKVMNDDIFKGIIRHCSENLVELDVSYVSRLLTYKSIELIAELCPNLERLNLSGGEVTDIGIKQIANKCKVLKAIHLQRCINIGEKGFWWLLHQSQKLTTVDISDNLRITGKCFYRMGPDIRILSLKSCAKLGEFGFQKIGEHCKDLVELNLTGCASLTDEGLRKICTGCSKLKKLSLSGSFSILTSVAIAHIGNLNRLNELDLSCNINVDDNALFEIGSSCVELRTLDVSACGGDVTDAGMTSLVRCHHLTTLNISYLEQVTDDSLCRLAERGTLEEVKLRGCMSISHQGCRQLLLLCPRLQTLDLSGCEMVGDAVMGFCLDAVEMRDEGPPLLVTIGGSSIDVKKVGVAHPLLKIETLNLCNPRHMPFIPCLLPSEEESAEENEWQGDDELDDFLDGEDEAMEFDREWMS